MFNVVDTAFSYGRALSANFFRTLSRLKKVVNLHEIWNADTVFLLGGAVLCKHGSTKIDGAPNVNTDVSTGAASLLTWSFTLACSAYTALHLHASAGTVLLLKDAISHTKDKRKDGQTLPDSILSYKITKHEQLLNNTMYINKQTIAMHHLMRWSQQLKRVTRLASTVLPTTSPTPIFPIKIEGACISQHIA